MTPLFSSVPSPSHKLRRQIALRLVPAFLALGLAAATPPVAAEGQTGKLGASAYVAKRATLKLLSQPDRVRITAEDIARGYVEVVGPVRAAIHSNSPQGYMLVFAGQGDFVRHARMRGLDGEVQLTSNGGVVTQRTAGQGVLNGTLELTFRFYLVASAQQGEHAWPMQVSIAPL